jgi:hypothetical protein
MQLDGLKPDASMTTARQRRLDSLVQETVAMAKRSGSRQAQTVAGVIEQYGQLAMPVLGGGLSREPLKSSQAFYIAPVTTADAILPSTDEDVRRFATPSHQGAWGAVHVPSSRTIYIPIDWPISPIWTKTALLHEGTHAWDTVTGRREGLTTWQLELRAGKVEQSALRGLFGGNRLNTLLRALHPTVERAIERRMIGRFDLPSSFDPAIAGVLGKPINRYDLDEQREAIRRLAVSHYLRHIRAAQDLWGLSVA